MMPTIIPYISTLFVGFGGCHIELIYAVVAGESIKEIITARAAELKRSGYSVQNGWSFPGGQYLL
jgi:hypothetical protein